MEFSKNGNISFGGVYVVNGSKEDVKKATDNLKKVAQYGYEKEIPLKTYTTNFKNSSSAIVATEDDSFTLSSAMKEPDFKQNVKDTFKASGSKKNFISNIVKNIFNNGGDVQNVDAKEIVDKKAYSKEDRTFLLDGKFVVDNPELTKEEKDNLNVLFSRVKTNFRQEGNANNKTRIYKDGTVVTKTHNGMMVSRKLPDGTFEEYKLNKVQLKTLPDGTKVAYRYNRDDSVLSYKTTGEIEYVSPEDKEVKEIVLEDDMSTKVKFSDDTGVRYNFSGNIMYTYKIDDEKTTYDYPNDTKKEIFHNGVAKEYLPNGSIKTINNQGIVKRFYYNNDGTKFVKTNGVAEYVDEATDETLPATMEARRAEVKLKNGLVKKYLTSTTEASGKFTDFYYPDGTTRFRNQPTIQSYKSGVTRIYDGDKLVSVTLNNDEDISKDIAFSKVLQDGTIEDYISENQISYRTYPNGTMESYNGYNELLYTFKDGKKINPNGGEYVKKTTKAGKEISEKNIQTLKAYYSTKQSLIASMAWELSPKTRNAQSELAKADSRLPEIFEKLDKMREEHDGIVFDELSPETLLTQLSEGEEISHKSFLKKSWDEASTEEFSESTKEALKIAEKFLNNGCTFSDMNDDEKTLIRKWIRENPKKYKALKASIRL